VTKIDYENIRSGRHIKDLCSRREILTFASTHPSSNITQQSHPSINLQHINSINSNQPKPTQTPSTMSSTTTTGAVPVTCCGRDGGCICAKEAKCSCGKQPAMQCTCEKSSTENKTSGARCSCSKSSFKPSQSSRFGPREC
jgi:hypothetical protein